MDPKAALNYAVTHAQQSSFSPAIATLGSKLFESSPEQARSMILDLPAAQATTAVSRIVTDALGMGEGTSETISPDVLGKWMLTLPPELWMTDMGYVVAAWDDKNRAGLLAWIDNQDSPATRDELTADYCLYARTNELGSVARMGFSIKDAKLRARTFSTWAEGLANTRDEKIRLIRGLGLTRSKTDYLVGLVPADQ
jgi:hypothetical protein